MNTPELHTPATQRLNELLHCPITQRHLTAYGWVEGMPVVFAHRDELVEDVMGFVSVHGRAVLLVLTNAQTDALQLWHVTIPSPSSPELFLCHRELRSRNSALGTARIGLCPFASISGLIAPRFTRSPSTSATTTTRRMPSCHLIIAEPCANSLVKPLKFLRILTDPQFRRFICALSNARPPAFACLTSHFRHPSANPHFLSTGNAVP